LRKLDRWLSERDEVTIRRPPMKRPHGACLTGCRLAESLALPPMADPDWVGGIAATLAESGSVGPGARVGPFEIEYAIGAGGMGAVYRARRVDGGFEQTVALKVLTGAKPAPEALSQFYREREALARLDHPGIARLIDGGMTEDWRPWFAMEHVDGLPIDRYVSELGLGLRERLRLFLDMSVKHSNSPTGNWCCICDIKPSNILVTPDGQIKLLDFRAGSGPGEPGSIIRCRAVGRYQSLADAGICQPRAADWQAGRDCLRGLSGRHAVV
jgi:hypothetical protein